MRVSDRCYAVTGLGYVAPWCVNAGFVVGDDVTLVVDTGANALAAATLFGYATSVRPSNQLRVINTEQHFDHIGGNSFFRDRGLEVWGHAKLRRTEEEFQAEKAEFEAGVLNPARREGHVFYGGTRLANPNRSISKDMVMDLGGCRVEVLLTPGHTPTNLSLWAGRDRVLFSGDCLINGYLPNLDAGGPADWETWLKSLDRIAGLRAETVVAGHGAVIHGEEVPLVIDQVRGVLRTSIERGFSPTRS